MGSQPPMRRWLPPAVWRAFPADTDWQPFGRRHGCSKRYVWRASKPCSNAVARALPMKFADAGDYAAATATAARQQNASQAGARCRCVRPLPEILPRGLQGRGETEQRLMNRTATSEDPRGQHPDEIPSWMPKVGICRLRFQGLEGQQRPVGRWNPRQHLDRAAEDTVNLLRTTMAYSQRQQVPDLTCRRSAPFSIMAFLFILARSNL